MYPKADTSGQRRQQREDPDAQALAAAAKGVPEHPAHKLNGLIGKAIGACLARLRHGFGEQLIVLLGRTVVGHPE